MEENSIKSADQILEELFSSLGPTADTPLLVNNESDISSDLKKVAEMEENDDKRRLSGKKSKKKKKKQKKEDRKSKHKKSKHEKNATKVPGEDIASKDKTIPKEKKQKVAKLCVKEGKEAKKIKKSEQNQFDAAAVVKKADDTVKNKEIMTKNGKIANKDEGFNSKDTITEEKPQSTAIQNPETNTPRRASSKSETPRQPRSSSRRPNGAKMRSRSRSLNTKKRSKSPSLSRKKRSPSRSTSLTKRSACSQSLAKKKRSRSRSLTRKKRSRSRSRSLPRNKLPRSRSRSLTKKHQSRSRSHSLPKDKRPQKSRSRSLTKKHPSRSRSLTKRKKHSRSRSLTKKKRSRSRSSSKKKNSHPRPRSPERKKRSRSRSLTKKKRSRSRSRSLNKKSQPQSRFSGKKRLSQSRSPTRKKRTRSRSPTRKKRSRSRSPTRKKRSRSRSPTKKRSSISPPKHRNNEMNRSPNFRSRSPHINKAQLLEIARTNLKRMQESGVAPVVAAPVEDARVRVSKSSGKTVEELTDYCKHLQQGESADESEHPSTPFHPFQIKARSDSIVMNIRNAIPLPVRKPEERIIGQSQLKQQFPVSSGQQHLELEWIPVTPSPTTNTKEVSGKTKDRGIKTNLAAVAPTPRQPTASIPLPPTPAIDIGLAVAKRLSSIKKLQDNQEDVQARLELEEAELMMQTWACVQNTNPMTGEPLPELINWSGAPQAWARKDQFTNAVPIAGGVGMKLLQKMGWVPGEGLGRNNEGTLEPLVMDIKLDKKGLVSKEEATPKSNSVKFIQSFQGKHPVSTLHELCTKRRWEPPIFEQVADIDPDHLKHFLFKVIVNKVEYRPCVASSTKKEAKAQSATLCLEALGITSTPN